MTIRFQRIGRKNDPAFRILVLEKARSPKSGTYTDLLGTYNPKTKALTIAADRLKDWVGKGAQISPSLANLLIEKKVLEGKKTNVLPKKTRIVKEEAKNEAAAPSAEIGEESSAADASAPEAAPTEETPAAEEPVEKPAEESAPAENPAA